MSTTLFWAPAVRDLYPDRADAAIDLVGAPALPTLCCTFALVVLRERAPWPLETRWDQRSSEERAIGIIVNVSQAEGSRMR